MICYVLMCYRQLSAAPAQLPCTARRVAGNRISPDACLQAARIPNEEQTLHQHFGKQWEQHCKRTWRLLPPIF